MSKIKVLIESLHEAKPYLPSIHSDIDKVSSKNNKYVSVYRGVNLVDNWTPKDITADEVVSKFNELRDRSESDAWDYLDSIEREERSVFDKFIPNYDGYVSIVNWSGNQMDFTIYFPTKGKVIFYTYPGSRLRDAIQLIANNYDDCEEMLAELKAEGLRGKYKIEYSFPGAGDYYRVRTFK